MRKSIIRNTAEAFNPDIMIVDKEPLGLKGEVEETLAMLKARGTTAILGLRDVMDAPDALERNGRRKTVLEKIDEYYDEVWVYGTPGFYDPLTGLAGGETAASKITYHRFPQTPPCRLCGIRSPCRSQTPILVTAGGGGDGAALMEWVFIRL